MNYRIQKGLTKTNKIADYLDKSLNKMGYKTRRSASGLSDSEYITIDNYQDMTGNESPYNNSEFKIRISDHDLPPSYDGKHGFHDADVMSMGKQRGGNDGNATFYENIIQKLNDEMKKGKVSYNARKKKEEEDDEEARKSIKDAMERQFQDDVRDYFEKAKNNEEMTNLLYKIYKKNGNLYEKITDPLTKAERLEAVFALSKNGII